MRRVHSKGLLASLKRVREAVLVYGDAARWSEVGKELDTLITVLSELRETVNSQTSLGDVAPVAAAVDTVIAFLQGARGDSLFRMAASPALGQRSRRAADTKIPSNLTNDQIREFLRQDLSRAQLEEIARQRSIALGAKSKEDLRSAILSFIDRQESYERLHA